MALFEYTCMNITRKTLSASVAELGRRRHGKPEIPGSTSGQGMFFALF